ncbi:MAG: methyltransferase domain-containing protein [Pyrinomonadaceae bacterium]
MIPDFKYRSPDLEHLDVGDYTPEEYEGCISELKWINRFLGDARALKKSLIRAIEHSGARQFSVLDVGAGSGELLRVIFEWAREGDRRGVLTGLELNERSASAIAVDAKECAEISAVRGSALELPFADRSFDYALCSLFIHHFTDDLVIKILQEMRRVARMNVFVIDLHRSATAYVLYKIVAKFFLRNRLTREDGALSIRRSFLPDELLTLARKAGMNNAQIQSFFPFRLVLTLLK